jgi:DNA-binding transcriptional MerR regulator
MAEKIYYSMGEVAEMLDVTPTLLRFWEKRFDIIKPQKNKKGNRLFSPDDVRNLKTIYHLVKERGMTLDGAARQLRAKKSEISRDMEIAERLAAIRALLLEVRNELGGDGTIIDNTVAEEVMPKPEGAAPARPPVPEPEPVLEPVPEPAPEPKPAPEPEPHYVEQTLF